MLRRTAPAWPLVLPLLIEFTTHTKHLQQGLDPASKAVRVFNFVRSMHKEVDALAHSCGVHKAQDLQRFHARMRTIDGKSASLEEVYPTPEPLQTIPS